MPPKHIHTVPRDGKWANIVAGNQRASGIYDTQAEANAAARERAIRDGLEHVIHGTDGKIRAKHSYGNDPFPPRG